MKYEKLAAEFSAVIRDLAGKEDALNNMESYLSYHFAAWMEKWAGYPEGLVSELKQFAAMYNGEV